MRRHYLREATFALALAKLTLRFVPPARMLAWANRPLRRVHRFKAEEASWIAWAVEDVAARRWMNALCLPRALAAHGMLRRRGIPSRLCLGVARQGYDLAAHAWVEVGSDKIVGGADAEGFTSLATFGTTSV